MGAEVVATTVPGFGNCFGFAFLSTGALLQAAKAAREMAAHIKAVFFIRRKNKAVNNKCRAQKRNFNTALVLSKNSIFMLILIIYQCEKIYA
jgi:flagellar biosynthesis regulator FlaF